MFKEKSENINDILDEVLYSIENIPNYKKSSKRYLDKYNMYSEYTNTKTDLISKTTSLYNNMTYDELLIEKDSSYGEYLYYESKLFDIEEVLNSLSDFEREIIVDWYTIPKAHRKKAESYADDKFISRRTFFRIKKKALKKLCDCYKKM